MQVKNSKEQGQTIAAVMLVMIVALGTGLALSTRFIKIEYILIL